MVNEFTRMTLGDDGVKDPKIAQLITTNWTAGERCPHEVNELLGGLTQGVSDAQRRITELEHNQVTLFEVAQVTQSCVFLF